MKELEHIFFKDREALRSWLNKRIVVALIKEGQMTEAGLEKIDVYQQTGS